MAKLTNEEVIASLKEMTILELNDLVKFLVGNIKVKSSHGGLFSFLRRKK